MSNLLTRDQFREGVFARDGYKCIFCESPAVDAHHILERRLWSDGGYYLANGASVCEEHHIKCETTEISVEEVREAAGILKKVIPEHLYDDHVYDKWGNVCLPNGMRMKGELFYDESVQKILAAGGKLSLFTDYVKYPRTYHLPWSMNVTEDDRVCNDISHFVGKEIVVTLKMDGENTTMYPDYIHARSIDGRNHTSRNWVKQFWSGISYDIPSGWRVCGENLYATHSIQYENLMSYFYGFSIWNEKNICLSWDETVEWFELLGIEPVGVIYRGVWDEKILRDLADNLDTNIHEGYVVRLAESFPYGNFKKCVAKFVRKNHIRTVQHNWLNRNDYEKNILKWDKDSSMKTFVKVNISKICEDFYDSQEEFGEWRGTYSNYLEDVFLSEDTTGTETITADCKVGDDVYVLWAIWSTGDSFGFSERGQSETIGVFKNEKLANNNKRLLNKATHGKVKIITDDGSKFEYYIPWGGYFENLDEIKVEKRTIKGEKF